MVEARIGEVDDVEIGFDVQGVKHLEGPFLFVQNLGDPRAALFHAGGNLLNRDGFPAGDVARAPTTAATTNGHDSECCREHRPFDGCHGRSEGEVPDLVQDDAAAYLGAAATQRPGVEA